MAFQRFLSAAAQGDEITLYGDGEQTRDFTFVGDVVRAFLAAGDALLTGAPRVPVLNVAGGSRASVNEVLGIVAALAGRALRVRRLPPQPGDVRDTWADTTLAAKFLGFRPATGLREGLQAQWQALRPTGD